MIGFQSKAFTLLRAEYYGAAVLKFNSNKSFCYLFSYAKMIKYKIEIRSGAISSEVIF